MLVGVPKEIKVREYRAGLVPDSVRELILHGHKVVIESNAGVGVGFCDVDYEAAGATVLGAAEEVFAKADLIVKVKEPQISECKMLREGQILFTYLHLAPDPAQTNALKASGCTAIAYETVTDRRGHLPLLTPMSEVAGRFAVQAAAHCLEKKQGGSGILLGGVPGVSRGKVTIIGGGVVGMNSMLMSIGKGAHVTVLEKSVPRLAELDTHFGSQVDAIYATAGSVEEHVLSADVVIGAVLIPGAAAPRLVTRDMLSHMQTGSVLVDVSIDQGGCFETSRPTTHDEPTYVEEGIVHYCVTNMPGAVPRTSTFALNNVTLPFVLSIADKGVVRALLDDSNFLNGLNVHKGRITHFAVAEALGLEYVPAAKALEV